MQMSSPPHSPNWKTPTMGETQLTSSEKAWCRRRSVGGGRLQERPAQPAGERRHLAVGAQVARGAPRLVHDKDVVRAHAGDDPDGRERERRDRALAERHRRQRT